MFRKYTALFFILVANIILLAHSVKIHHHYDDLDAGEKVLHTQNHDTNHANKHRHQHQFPIENEQDNLLNAQHEHDFPKHWHTVLTDFFVVKSVNQTNQTKNSKPINKTEINVFLITELYDRFSEPAIKSVYYHRYKITSLFNSSAFSLRGPPIL